MRKAVDTTVEVGATALGVVVGLSVVSPELGIVTQGISALVGGVLGRLVGGALTNRVS